MSDVIYPDGGRLEVWHCGKQLDKAASVDFDMLPHLRKLGRWHLNVLYDKMVGSPRSYHRCVDQFGKRSQVNLSLHRVVFALGNLNEDQRVKLMGDFDMLLNVQRNLPQIKFLNGFFFDCRFCNLSAVMSDRTIKRKEQAGKPVSLEYAFPNELVRPVEVNGVHLSEEEAVRYRRHLEEQAGKQAVANLVISPILTSAPPTTVPTFPEPPKETVFDQMLKKYREGGYDKPEVTKTEPSAELGSGSETTVERLGDEFNPDKAG